MSGDRIRIGLFGSTGSIGRSALSVVDHLPEVFEVEVLASGSNATALADQIVRFSPARAVIGNPERRDELAAALRQAGFRGRTKLDAGPEALEEAAAHAGTDVVLSAITGSAGLPVSLAAVRAGRRLALANKESMVVAGPILTDLARKHGAEIIPVDSEHSAIFQALKSGRQEEIDRLVLTASGGPLRTLPRSAFASVTREDALNHPTWRMGPKITIDSATLMNKALEIIEARWLFDVEADRIDVLIHPQSIVHSMVSFRDGSVVAQLGVPDMRIPIQYALTYPRRLEGPVNGYVPARMASLTFEPPDTERFPSLGFGFETARRGGNAGAVLNAANEEAVTAFLEGRIAFPRIFDLVGSALARFRHVASPGLDDLLASDAWAREETRRCL